MFTKVATIVSVLFSYYSQKHYKDQRPHEGTTLPYIMSMMHGKTCRTLNTPSLITHVINSKTDYLSQEQGTAKPSSHDSTIPVNCKGLKQGHQIWYK